jgi:hypothetical protein
MSRSKSWKGLVPGSWRCIDCGINTAPGHMTRQEMDNFFAFNPEGKAEQSFTQQTEIYQVRSAIWKAAGM